MNSLVGQQIGRYHILEQVGSGGMAIVYKAYDTRLERTVAVKMLRIEQFIPAQLQMVLQRFEREAKSLAKFSHPNIVNILDYGEFEGMPYLVMAYLPGGNFKGKMDHAFPWEEAVHWILPVARGLAYAHQHGIIHRDVKPANIMLDEHGSPILTDFGIAKLLENTDGMTLTGSGVGIGTPEYMAPEQGMTANVVDARADIYALGIVLYEMVTGRKPYTADTPLAVLLKQINDPLPRPRSFVENLPEEVENILFKALAKKPEDRYQSMEEFISALEKIPAGATIAAMTLPVVAVSEQTLQSVAVDKTLQQPLPQVQPPASSRRLSEKKSGRFGNWYVFGALSILLIVVIGVLGWLLVKYFSPVVSSQPTVISTGLTMPTKTFQPATLTPRPPTRIPTKRPTSTPIPQIPGVLPWNGVDEYPVLRDFVENPDAPDNVYIVNLQPEQQLRFGWGWCTKTQELLKQNLANMEYHFFIDDVEVTHLMGQVDNIQEGYFCHLYSGVIRSWPPGKYTLRYEMIFLQKVNDGENDYEGKRDRTYIVTVNP